MNKVKKEWGLANVYKAILLLYEWLIRDENVQVNGIKYFVDYTGITLAMATLFSDDDQKVLLNFFQVPIYSGQSATLVIEPKRANIDCKAFENMVYSD